MILHNSGVAIDFHFPITPSISMNKVSQFLIVAFLGWGVSCKQAPPSQEDTATEEKEIETLRLEHREFGIEEFTVGSAWFNLYEADEGNWEFVVSLKTTKAQRRVDQLVEVATSLPSIDATSLLAPYDVTMEPGKIFSQERGFDGKMRLSTLQYLHSHQIDELRIELLEVNDSWIEAKLSGVAAVSGGNSNNPDLKISVRARFRRDIQLRR